MIALDTNILVRFLVLDDVQQAEAARVLLESLTIDNPAYVCREVTIELVWVLERAYGFPRSTVAMVLEELLGTEGLVFETADDVACVANQYGATGMGFSRLMALAAAKRSAANPVYTFEQESAQLEGVSLL